MIKRVLMLLDHPFRSDARVEKEIAALSEAGYRFTVIAERSSALPQTEERTNYRVIRYFDELFRTPLRKGYNAYLKTVAEDLVAHDFDLIHCHDYALLPFAAELKKLKGVPLIYDSHEYLAGWPFYLQNKGLANQLKGYFVWKRAMKLEKQSAQEADAVVTITAQIAERLARRFALKVDPLVLRNIPEPFEIKRDSYFHRKFNLAPQTKVMVQSGSINQSEPQMKALFELVGSTKNLVLVIIGNLSTHERLKKKVLSENAYPNKIFFHNYMANQKEQGQLLAQADIGLFHLRNRWEAHRIGSSNRFLEYSFAGLAILGTRQLTAVEVAKQFHHALFYEESNFEQMAALLQVLLADLDTFKTNALKVRESVSWSNEVKGLIDLYKNLLPN